MNDPSKRLTVAASRLAEVLNERRLRVVFAESCTAGLVAASLATIPGISEWLCGSAVVYRDDTKARWLGVSAADLKKYSAVSEPVACGMALGSLRETPEATWSASVTGHLGPNAPEGQDGLVYVAVACRFGRAIRVVDRAKILLRSRARTARQNEAAVGVLQRLCAAILQGVCS